VKILTIQRSKWRRGGGNSYKVEGYGPTRLLNDRGYMCCLGFDALACGFTENNIYDRTDPESLGFKGLATTRPGYAELRLDFKSAFLPKNTPPVQEAITINDSHHITDDEREEALHVVFRQLGYDGVVFVD
jgi:hypothetical protein